MSRTITFYKLISPYTEDITKNCSLFGNEIDDNFMNLKELSIDSVELSGTTIIIKRIGNEQLTVDLSEIIPDEPTMSVSYDEELGKIQIEFNEETFIIDGLLNQVNSTKLFLKKVAADLTLTGNGTIQNPLTINLTHKTGMYEPAIEYLDLTSGDTLPTSGMSIGDSYITKEIRNSFGYLYNLEGINEIKQSLLAENSEWRVPTKEDWDVMLNALECDGFKNHNNTEVSIILGKDAGKILKSREYWQESNETNAGNDTYLFSSIPSGYGDDTKLITHAYEWGEYWTDTESSDFEHYTKQFRFDETGVYQLSRNINDYFSLRLVKTYNGENLVEYEKINNAIVKTDLMPSDSGETRLVWTMEDLNFGEDNYGGLRTPLLDEITETDLFYNVWNGNIWLKRKMKEGETTVILSDSGDTSYNICMVVNHELINTNLNEIAISGQVLTNIEDIEYLETNKANVSDLLSVSGQVSANTEDISNLYTNKADKATTLSGYGITDAYIKTESDGKYETIENVDLLRNIVSGNTEDIEYLEANKADKATTLSGYGITDAYTKTESDGKYETIENVDLLEGIVSGNTEDIENLQSDKADKATTLSGYGITDAYTKTESDGKYETIENVDLLEGIVSGNTEAIENLQSDKADKATTLSGYGITDAYNKTEIDNKISTVFRYKGSVATYNTLTTLTGMLVGDVYNVNETGDNYAWTGTLWDKLAGEVDLSAYLTSANASNTYETITNVNFLRNIVTGNTEGIGYLQSSKANASDVLSISAQVLANNEDIFNLQSDKADKATTLSGYGIANAYTKTESDGKYETIENVDLLEGIVSGNTEAIENLQSNKANTATTLSGYGITDAYTKTESDNKYETIANIDLLEDIVSGNTEDISVLQSNKADASDLSSLSGQVSVNTEAIENLQSNKANTATTLSGYGITDAYTKTEINNKISAVFRYKGSVSTYFDLIALTGMTVGDVYNVTETGDNYAWTDIEWDKLAGVIDLSAYLTIDSASNTYETIANVSSLSNTVSGHTDDIENLEEKKANKTNTLGGYGIEDAYTKTEVDDKLDNIEHNDILNRNGDPDFLHITETEKTNFVTASDFVEDFISNATAILYADLLALINNNALIPSSNYRITDYTTTTAQADTTSAGHNFDVIVTALSTNKLSENAKCVRKAGDAYFENAKLETWEIKYCIDNDTNRFAWAFTNAYINVSFGTDPIYNLQETKVVYTSWGGDNVEYFDWKNSEDIHLLSITETPSVSEDLYYLNNSFGGELDIWHFGPEEIQFNSLDIPKGVIYYMKDEWGNECPYDFKNIQFKKSDILLYTFGGTTDDSLTGGCHHNTMMDYISSSVLTLNFNTFGVNSYSNTFGYDCRSNTFGNNSYSNTFGNDCQSNTFNTYCIFNIFGDNCNSNTLDEDCSDNTFGIGCSNNNLGAESTSNKFGNNCYSNTFDSECRHNKFGNNFYSNTFGAECTSNTFGTDCKNNIFNESCQYNTFGNSCDNNALGNYCGYNTFGNDCYSNTFGNYCNYNTFGNDCRFNNFYAGTSGTTKKDYIRYIVLEDGCRNNIFYSNLTTSSLNYLQRIRIKGLENTTPTNTQILLSEVNTKHEWIVAKNSSAIIEQYCPEDLLTNKANKANTLGGYGIEDAYTKTEVDNLSNVITVTHNQLFTLFTNSELIPGKKYRIVDYTTTTTQTDTQSAGHDFDIIVTALSTNELSENAKAVKHVGDTYFTNAKLEAWEIKYCIDNDTTRFAWANTTNGKGVIYYMKDEWENECPYDFKNIQFKRYPIISMPNGSTDLVFDVNNQKMKYALKDSGGTIFPTGAVIDENNPSFYYTFNAILQDSGTYDIYDASVIQNGIKNDEGGYFVVQNNKIKEAHISSDNLYDYGQLLELNNIVINNIINSLQYTEWSYGCSSNTFGYGCFNNTFGDNFYNNTFGSGCSSNTFGYGCFNNTFGNNCYSNTFGDYCNSNTFGYDCRSNTFGDACGSNTFGAECTSNTFGNNCYSNTFGDNCERNTFGNRCQNNTFGNNCAYNNFYHGLNGIIKKDNIRYIVLEDGCRYNNFYSDVTTSYASFLQRIRIKGLGHNTPTKIQIELSTLNAKYEWVICYTSGNVLKQYCPDD